MSNEESAEQPVTLTYMAVLEEIVGDVVTFEVGDITCFKLEREHWISLGRPGVIDVRVRDMAGL